MSLKAKLEAVIYAAEEPVTLAQLSALFTEDALEWKAAQEAASASQDAQDGEAAAELEPGPLVQGLADLELDSADSGPTEPMSSEPESSAEPDLNSSSDVSSKTAGGVVGDTSGSGTSLDTSAGPAAELAADDEKRVARQRDREVRAIIKQLLDELMASYASDDHGIEIREVAGGYRMATKPECHDAVRSLVKSLKPALKLSLPALETLAVIAYKQPVTAPEVNEIRGVDSSGVFGSLLARKLIATAGRKQVIGRPILYKTTREFLLRFGLKDVSELPSMEEFEKMAVIELDEEELSSGSEQQAQSAAEPDEQAETEVEQPADEPEAIAAHQTPDGAAAEGAPANPTPPEPVLAEPTLAEAAPAEPLPTE